MTAKTARAVAAACLRVPVVRVPVVFGSAEELMTSFHLTETEVLDAALTFINTRDLEDDFRANLDENYGVP